MVCNVMTCQGFSDMGEILGTCSLVWISMVVLFFIIVFARKWIGEAMGVPFFTPAAFLLGFALLIILSIFTCSHKWALAGGVIGAAVGAFLGGQFFGEGS